MDSSLTFLPLMPPLSLISDTASSKPLTSASPYAAAVPELVVTEPMVMVSPDAALEPELDESSMLPPEQPASDMAMAAAAPAATNLLESFTLIPEFLLLDSSEKTSTIWRCIPLSSVSIHDCFMLHPPRLRRIYPYETHP